MIFVIYLQVSSLLYLTARWLIARLRYVYRNYLFPKEKEKKMKNIKWLFVGMLLLVVSFVLAGCGGGGGG
ncbi:MAG: hypothetical protein M0Z89_05705, partial [Nitrospiraceae bacterium]|nr:hypothetical protein [Nitrospiraceae bacterium]